MSDEITCTIHDAPLDACACPRDWLGYRAQWIAATAATAEIATLRAELANVLASACPNERDHPAMSKAWKRARAELAGRDAAGQTVGALGDGDVAVLRSASDTLDFEGDEVGAAAVRAILARLVNVSACDASPDTRGLIGGGR